MVSESNAGHAYVNWGDFPKVERIDNGLLGASLESDPAAGHYRITQIYPGENWNPARRSPLAAPGVDVQEGDFLIAVNGIQVPATENPYRYLENLAGKRTEITVSANADGSHPRTSVIEPIASETELLYLQWVNERRALVEKLSGGRIGYIHVPNTAIEGNRELFRGMYAYHNKEALIIDDRYNGGGFIPDVMTALLERQTLSYWQRNGLTPMRTPGIAHDGPKAMLINGYSSSGGDAFPYFFKKKRLGTLIGTRTWGGLIGISSNAVMADGGSLSVPRFGIYDENGQWIIEGIGVYPDVEVVDRPEQLATGVDPSIEKAVELLMKELNENPAKEITTPKPPDRSGWIEKIIR
jgi:tricorn protease